MFPNILVAFLVVWATHRSGQSDDGRCISVPLIENYNIQKILGNWYCQEIGDEDDGSHTCLQYNMTTVRNGTIFATRIYNGLKKAQPYKALQVKNTSEFKVEWKGRIRPGWTVATDYKSWSTWYICYPEETNKGILFIMTREKYPSEATMEKARNSARKIGFNLSKPYLKTIDFSNCDKIES